ncbi:hypothetical protein DXG03_002211 [Asterophora parasitica]|uniref:Uncharacterized protein n=1 Tax=Asterophora parasitica TaxID=117018 RepID=A0A9P7GC34_9AGAR|nr:hypothetical protein DXG03_002211 [Asterophora parasitica]
MKRSFDSDPLTLAMAPPPDETQEERAAREEKEEHAREVSKRIDAEIKVAKAAMKKRQRAVKVLVLGQSMSDFQMTYAQRAWAEERDSWKAVILLNLVQSINIVVGVLLEELDIARSISSDPADRIISEARSSLSETQASLTLRLAPLRQIERDLKSLLGSGATENDVVPNSSPHDEGRNILHEFALRSSSGWRTVLDHVRNPTEGKAQQLQRVACDVICGLKDDILQLWKDDIVHTILRTRQIQLEDRPGFFLHDVERIASTSYVPTDEDVVRARLRTTGVQEYEFTLDKGAVTSLGWLWF